MSIGDIGTYQKFNTVYPNEVLSNLFFGHEYSSNLRSELKTNQDIDTKQQVKTHSGSQWI